MEAVAPTEIERARERSAAAHKELSAAMEASRQADAEHLRLAFLAIVDEFPSKIKGLSFDSEYCYDDEGGYFISDSVYPLEGECTAEVEGWDPYVLEDLNGWGHEALCVLCGVHTESFAGQITVAEARERRF